MLQIREHGQSLLLHVVSLHPMHLGQTFVCLLSAVGKCNMCLEVCAAGMTACCAYKPILRTQMQQASQPAHQQAPFHCCPGITAGPSLGLAATPLMDQLRYHAAASGWGCRPAPTHLGPCFTAVRKSSDSSQHLLHSTTEKAAT